MTPQHIHISGLKCDAVIGILAHEKSPPQPLVFDVEVTIDARAAIASDAIGDTLDYATLSEALIKEAQARPRELLERLHHELLMLIARQPNVCHASLRIYKPQALEHLGAVVSISGEWVAP